jgi:hypothetical protein
MKPSRFLRTLLLPALAFNCLICENHGFAQNAPVASGTDSLPAPPMQKSPWTPPATKLPPALVSAVTELFDQGLADPRGCEYREVEIDGGIDDYPRNMKVHAWVLPGDGKQKYAVGWNGRVNLVVSVGEAADLRKDFTSTPQGLGVFRTNWGIYDFSSLSEKVPLPIKTALLLRAGEGELAEATWREGAGNFPDPYVEIAREWLESWYHRATVAHEDGQDRLALQILRALPPLEQAVEATAAKRGLQKFDAGTPYLKELGDLPVLAADQERRAKEPAREPVLKSGLPASGLERVTALIGDLELIRGRRWSNKSETEVYSDPIVVALINEGDKAVEPLIECLEKDNRLTRTWFVGAGLMPRSQGPWISVYEPAYFALTGILKTTVIIPLPQNGNPHALTPTDRKALADKFRAYWAAHKGMSPPERWFSTLQDDNASPAEWFRAAENITQGINQTTVPPNLFFGGGAGTVYQPGPGSRVAMRGESLRDKSNPSVSDLLVRRFNQALPLAEVDKEVTFASISTLLFALADWDGKARAEDLRNLARQFNAKFQDADVGFNSTAKINGTLYEKRLAAGDPSAIAEYAVWVSSLKPENCYDARQILRIMWEHPTDPAIVKAAGIMFAGKNSPWRPRTHYGIISFVNTPLLGMPAFREQVLKALDDTSVIGYTRRYRPDDSGLGVHMSDDSPEDARPDAPPKVDFRLCDYYASKLSDAETFPVCKLDWPQDKRDAVVEACKAMLRQYGDAFQFHSSDPAFEAIRAPNDHTQPSFPRLDHPATTQDVSQGRAIFSLAGETRSWPMPAFPLYANRPSSKQDPQRGMESLPDGESKDITTYTTDGHVWQAEEVLVDGKWERYYGFSGRHQLEKVRAAEIEFPSGYPYVAATPFIDCKLEGPQSRQLGSNSYTSTHVSNFDAPLAVTVKARNRSGLDQHLPDVFMLPPNASKALPQGVVLHLSYSEKIPPDALNPPSQPPEEIGFGPGRIDYAEWHEIPLRKEIATAMENTPGSLLGAASELTLFKIELRDYFDITRPGSYRLQAAFQAPGQPAAKTEEIIFTLVEKTN